MDFDALFGPDDADGETVDDGYTYVGYNDDGAEAYNGIDDDFNFQDVAAFAERQG